VRPYETMVIFDAGSDPAAIQAVIERSQELIRSTGGRPGVIDRWGRRPFAYEVRHKREGYYVRIEMTGETVTVDELHRMLSLADEVVRHKVIRLPEKPLRRSPSGGPGSGARGPPGGRPTGAAGPLRPAPHASPSAAPSRLRPRASTRGAAGPSRNPSAPRGSRAPLLGAPAPPPPPSLLPGRFGRRHGRKADRRRGLACPQPQLENPQAWQVRHPSTISML